MNYMGDFLEDATVYITFNTFDSNDPSASVTITDLVAGDVEVWKNGVVQTTPGAGVTITLNIGTNNGTHLIAVDTSNTTDGGFYVISADYQVRINGTTIDGATVNAWVGTFSIENRFKEVNLTEILGTAVAESTGANIATNFNTFFDDGDSATSTAIMSHIEELAAANLPTDVAAIPTTMVGTDNAALATNYTATRAGYLDELAAANLPTDIADIPTVAEFEARTIVSADYVVVGDTLARVTLTDTVTTYTGNTKQTGNNFARLGAPAGASVSADIAAIPTVNEIWAKAMTDLAQGAPSSTASVLTAINYLYEALRNKTLTTATLITIMKDNGTTALMKSTISDDSTTFTKDEFISGA